MNYYDIVNTCTEHPFFCIILVSTILFFACVFFRGWPISSSSEESYGDSEDDYEDDEDNCDGDCDECSCKSQLSIEGKYNLCIKEKTHPASPAIQMLFKQLKKKFDRLNSAIYPRISFF